jgi:DnaJ-domain-containing protein 1
VSVVVLGVVAIVAAVVVLLPVAVFQSLAAAFEGGVGPGGERGRDPGAYRRKTQADLREQARDRVATFLDEHDVAYETDRDFATSAGTVTAPFYLPDEAAAVILDDWYEEYLLSKHADVATVIVELHVTLEHQLLPLRRLLGIEAETGWDDEPSVSVGGDAGADAAAVLDLDGRDVTVSELKSAYRERIKETHPDQNDAPDAEEQFQRVQRAYEDLREEVAD